MPPYTPGQLPSGYQRPTAPTSGNAADWATYAHQMHDYGAAQTEMGQGSGSSGGRGNVYSGNVGDYEGAFSNPRWYATTQPNKVVAGQTLMPEYGIGQQQQGLAQQMYSQALANPTGAADQYGKYFQAAANAYTQPAMQDFNQQLARVQGNTAARFGGNASTEEQRNVYNTSNLFSRNLTNALAGLAPQQAAMGQAYTSQLANAYALQSQNQMALRNAILSGLSPGANQQEQPTGSVGGSILGALGGAVSGFAAGGPVGAIAGGVGGLANGTTAPGVGLYNGYTGGY